MPHALEHRLCWLIQQEGEEDEEVEFFTTIAQDIVETLSWFAWYDWRIMLVGVHKAGCGMWLSFVDLPTLQQLPDVTDAMMISGPWHRVKTGPNQFVVSGGQAIMNLAAQGWRKALRNEAGTCVEINQCAGCTRQFFPKSFLGDDAAVLAPSSGEEPASPRYRAGVASMAWRTTRRCTNAP